MIFKFNFPHILLGLLALFSFSQCSDSSDSNLDQATIDRNAIEAYIAENDSNAVAHESGIYYSILDTVPTGAETGGRILSIYYSAKVLNGDAYDINSRADGDDSVKLKQGIDAVFPVGLDIGLGLMKEGEIFRFYIPSTLGYQDYSFSSLIPENSILEIEVEVAAVQGEDDIITAELDAIDQYIINENLNDTIAHPKDSVLFLPGQQIYYKRLTEGTENDTLRNNDLSTISYVGRTLNGAEFDRRTNAAPLTYTFGANVIIAGLDEGISQMERGESALIILPSHKAYGESVFVIPSYRKQDFVDLEIIPLYAAKVAPYEIVLFETSLLNNP
ncbi:FKBP-type peptidyl-prolyl cis-trans isomerase [Reichenbachiella sp.]|uniref:FKBP-type peptidyl-prolyl cis-trans isomerase n=1 Tax=Reichenbachiella sp. TaxID=2184521 RepID=UPI003B5A08B1